MGHFISFLNMSFFCISFVFLSIHNLLILVVIIFSKTFSKNLRINGTGRRFSDNYFAASTILFLSLIIILFEHF